MRDGEPKVTLLQAAWRWPLASVIAIVGMGSGLLLFDGAPEQMISDGLLSGDPENAGIGLARIVGSFVLMGGSLLATVAVGLNTNPFRRGT